MAVRYNRSPQQVAVKMEIMHSRIRVTPTVVGATRMPLNQPWLHAWVTEINLYFRQLGQT
jgi:hypothetical protein